ncbi:MAG: GAF domain-containing sensor histidine kinase [Elusimicrobiota bacterium]
MSSPWEWYAASLAAASCASAVYWYMRFEKILPMDRRLRLEQEKSSALGAFAKELFEAQRPPESPQLISETLQFGVERFSARFAGLHLFLWRRMAMGGSFSDVGAELVARTGFLPALEPVDMELGPELWRLAASSPEKACWRGDIPPPLGERLKFRGLRSGRLLAWGKEGRIWGILGVLDADPEGRSLEEHGKGIELLAAFLSAAADRAAALREQSVEREQLEGGLSATMQRLDETNLQLIQKAREMRSLHEVTDAISAHPDRPDSLGPIASTVAKALDADVVVFLLLDDDTGDLVSQPGAYGLADDESSLYRISLKNEMASSVRVFRSGVAFATGDALNDPRVIAHYARLWKVNSLIVVPLRIEDRRIGVMRVGSFRKNFFNEGHVEFVQVIAEEAAVLIENAMRAKRLVEMNSQLAHLHRLKDDFVSTVSHEFKTPLTTIRGFLDVVLEGEAGPLTDDQRKFLGISKSSAERLTLLVSDLLDISKLEGGVAMEFAPLDLGEAAARCVENNLWEADRRKIRLELKVPARLPQAHGDARWLSQVFDNLISNAFKFTPAGGRVLLSIVNKGECLQACVEDSGVGVAAEEAARLFEKFYRAKSHASMNAPGTGLGLAICKSIIDKHEGKIWVESEPGNGARFIFLVPVAKGPPSSEGLSGA